MILKTQSLSPEMRKVIVNKGTEQPFVGIYDDFNEPGTYLCRQCGLALFRSETKFHSGCGWPSFDNEILGAVKKLPDADGRRTEILCMRCHAHLGHVFIGEGFTEKNVRHCVNSVSLDFVSDQGVVDSEEAILAGGCFWGMEYYFKQLPGVLKTEVGYIGGNKDSPSYEEVCHGATHHYEATRVVYDPSKLSYERLIKFFFEIHDPTQANGQGPDIGEQYQSAIFYYNKEQKEISEQVINLLNQKGCQIVTKLLPISVFWPAEQYHQNYYTKTSKLPYCHRYEKKF